MAQKTDDPKSNEGNLTFPTHTVNVIELQSNKRSRPPKKIRLSNLKEITFTLIRR